MALTDTACRNAKKAAKDYKLTDGSGLHLLVKPSGSKLWRMQYRFGGKQRTLTFGPYPTVSLADARELRRDAKRKLSFGIDPAIKRAGEVEGITFEKVAHDWFAVWKDGKDEAHIDRVMARLKRDVFPDIGALPISSVEAPQLLSMIRKVEARGALDIAKRIRQTCGQIFGFAIASGLVKYDPTPGLRSALRKGPKVKHFVKVPWDEFPVFLAKVDRYDGEAMTRLALLFTLLTWVRSNETRFAVWEEFEGLEGKEPIWRIPAARMKMEREHLVPLSPQAVAILKQVPRSDRLPYVFWSNESKTGVISENTMIYALYRLGYKSRQTVHGFRRLASTWANEELVLDDQRVSRRYHEDWVEMQLAHSEQDDSRGAYNAAEYLLPRRRMLVDWANTIDHLRKLGRAKLRDLDELI